MVDSFMEFAHVDEDGSFGFDFSALKAEEIDAMFSEMMGFSPEDVDESGNEFLTNEEADEMIANMRAKNQKESKPMKVYIIYVNEYHRIGQYEPREITTSRRAAEESVQSAKQNGCACYFVEKELSDKLVRI